jgi:endonuclease G, mitochondrial
VIRGRAAGEDAEPFDPGGSMTMKRMIHAAVLCAAFFGAAAAGWCQLPLDYYLPAVSPQGKMIRHTAFTLEYNEKFRQPNWVICQLSSARISAQAGTAPEFRADPALGATAVQPDSYRGTGYERGQLVPLDGIRWSRTALAEAYYTSAVCPMKSAFMKSVWAVSDSQIIAWTKEFGDLYVVSGPVLKGILPAAAGGVPAPKFFFRVLLAARGTTISGIGFLLPADGPVKAIMSYAVPIDSVEAATGLNFFPNLPDIAENGMEASFDPKIWVVNVAPDGGVYAQGSLQKGLAGKTFTPAVLCRGITKDGKPCTRMTTNPNGYCWEHQDQAKKAGAK